MKSPRTLLPGQLRLILGITMVHVVAWFAYYSQIPAGQYPGEEARTTLETARTLADGMPTGSSGHSLYTYTLSILARFFGDSSSLTSAARGLNALALVIATGFCASAAGHYWRRNRAVWISGLLVGLNPLLVFWAGEVSPSLLATACMTVALWRGIPWLRRPSARNSLWIGMSLTLAALFETTLLPIALLWPALAVLFPYKERILHLIFALIPVVMGFGLVLVSSLQLQDTFQWQLDQLGSGLYQALGSQETYDGKSFSLYRQLHLLLYLNPIHWGAIFILAAGGAYARLKDGHSGRSILLALVILTFFAISFALNGSGSQARASMIPLLAILAAGCALLPKIWNHASKPTRRKMITGAASLCLFSYAAFLFGTPQSKSWEPDYVYLAEANIRLGNNDRATTWAEKALELNPSRGDMQEVLVIAQFNDWTIGTHQRSLPSEATEEFLEASRQLRGTPTTLSIRAIYLYKLREIEPANELWQAAREESALALLCLYWTGAIIELSPNDIKAQANSPYYELLEEASIIDRNALDYGEIEKLLDNILAFAY